MNGPYFTGRDFDIHEEMPQLFNLHTGPEECYDLSEHHPDLTAQLAADLAEFDADLRADHAAHYGDG